MEFEDYVAEQRHALLRFACVLCGDPRLADEIVADVLGRAFERWPQVSAAEHVHAYVRRMVVNDYLGRKRRAWRTVAHADLSAIAAPVADHADRHAEHVALVGELARLAPRQRAAVVLRFYEGYSHAEIAAILGTGENAVRSNLSRALRHLRVKLTDDPDSTRYEAPKRPARPAPTSSVEATP